MALKDYLAQEVALDCEAGLLSRREALRRLGLMGVTGAAAAMLLAACGDGGDGGDDTGSGGTSAPSGAAVPPSPTSSTPTSSSPLSSPPASAAGEEIRFAGPNGELIGLLAEADAPRGAVLVIHEN